MHDTSEGRCIRRSSCIRFTSTLIATRGLSVNFEKLLLSLVLMGSDVWCDVVTTLTSVQVGGLAICM